MANTEVEFGNICSSWQSSAWDEIDWSRLKDIHLRDNLELRQQSLFKAEAVQCIECPQFVRHVRSVWNELVGPYAYLDGSSFLITTNG